MRIDPMRRTRLTVLGAACAAALAAGACKKANNPETAGAGMSSAADTAATGMAPADTGSMAAHATLTDANIVALLDEANKADSAAGAYAVGKAKDPGVKAFAKLMMSEHHALRVAGQQLAKKLNVTPEPPANDPLKPAAAAEMDSLKAATGSGFDRTYIDQEVGVHKAVLDLAKQAHDQTQNAELKALIEKAQPVIQKHLDKAEELQKTLGKTAA